ncbi:UNVERIFIED_CONTAM: hypothetical protein Slati_0153700 [Sesamum latifolium]|uniref:Endonuclease/exonuclease/phosphatase domain-containing protein n=1 Tax=Sesamum latifolium TaxID=2727402 RepID=A0AAW2YAB9_9LAMI
MLLRDNNPALVFLAETKCSSRLIESLKWKFDLYGFCVPATGKSGGLAILWVKSVSVQMQSFSRYHIDLSVQLDVELPIWRFTGIYGELETSKRSRTWQLLSRLYSQSCQAWIYAGDYNELLDTSEKQGGPPRPSWQMRNFRQALEACELHDVGCTRDPFTWSNRYISPRTVLERLDRACANMGWSHLFPNAMVTHLPVTCSDHKALLIQLEEGPRVVQKCSRSWRFEAAWLQSNHCEVVVMESWGVANTPGGVSAKLAACQQNLASWDRNVFRADRNRLAAREETVWRQRSKDTWIREGDRNTSFFHQRASNRFKTNVIRRVRDVAGNWVVNEEDIRQCIVSHFSGVYASCRPQWNDIAKGTENLQWVVDDSMAGDLMQPYTEEEVTQSSISNGPSKISGT